MPGYILHLTAARMVLDMLPESSELHRNPKSQNDFLIGSLLPDVVKEKAVSHFRNPDGCGNIVEYPDLDLFFRKYRHLMGNRSCLGYYFHLYIDRRFFREYLPEIVEFMDYEGRMTIRTAEVAWVHIRRTGEKIPVRKFFSDIYYYGDYTNMNTYLMERYHLPIYPGALDISVENPGIEEVDYADISRVLDELQEYLVVPVSAIGELKVFDVEDLLKFLHNAAKEFVVERC
ncbi:hypothetical protein ACQRBN_11600 [Bariatricus sp. SGI.154]|uniref:hypothetical protein n=1 Tax=Bariatricus sp. SGI.154 TaxID=3420549 RepID=UPI003CFC1B66